jgi:hypothetical protein
VGNGDSNDDAGNRDKRSEWRDSDGHKSDNSIGYNNPDPYGSKMGRRKSIGKYTYAKAAICNPERSDE